METENKKKNTLLIVVLCLLAVAIIAGTVCFVLERHNNASDEINGEEEEIELLEGYYEAELDGKDYNLFLIIKDDKTFISGQTSLEVVNAGNYSFIGNYIQMDETINYLNRECFNSEDFVVSNTCAILNFATIECGDEVYRHDDRNIEQYTDYFVVNPEEGKTPKGETKPWISCANKKEIDSKWISKDYESEFKEDSNTVLDYDMKTNYGDFNYKAAYDLVIKESSKLKKGSNINLFNYVGRVNEVNDYYYVNYDVNFYNLPESNYNNVRSQLLEDKKTKTATCSYNRCSMKITPGYESISNFLSKSAFYYYIFDGANKVETRSIMSQSFVTSNIPDEWLKLGSYKTKDDMFKDVLLMIDESHKYDNYLVIYDTGSELKFKYKGKSITVIDSKNYYEDIYKLYMKDSISGDINTFVGGYKAKTDDVDGEPFYYYMVLRKDGSYTYGNSTAYGGREVGTYALKNGKITMHDVVSYGSDACYFTDESYLNDRSLTIKDNNTLEITEGGKTYTFVKDNTVVEDASDLARYITNPVNGKVPSEGDDAWVHCDKEGNEINSTTE